MVHNERIPKYHEVNRRMGYPAMNIESPQEVARDY